MQLESAPIYCACMYQKYLDPVIQQFTTGEHYKGLFEAKKEYFERAGIVYEDDAEYENRMTTFLDWYIFDRPLPGIDLPPIKYFYHNSRDKF